MSDQVIFYYNPMSRGRVVHWMLEEVEADYQVKLIDLRKNEQKAPDYLKINPLGKVPSIVHKAVVVTEVAAICTYLADAFPKAGLAPPVNDPARGTYYRWLFFAASCLEPVILDRKNPRQAAEDPGRLGYSNYDKTVNALEACVANGFIVGNRFSAADVYVASYIEWLTLQQELERRPAFDRYLELCQARPAYQRFDEKAAALAG